MKKFSKKWMSKFIEGELPYDNNFILEEVSKKSFEVEGFEIIRDESGVEDVLFDIKILPNRISDAYCLRGMAREWAAVFGLKPKEYFRSEKVNILLQKNEKVEVVSPAQSVFYFSAIKVNNFDNRQESPDWLKDIIVKSGGRSINLLVDLTNLILFVFGQPAHVFDANKVVEKLYVRNGRKGESLELLDGNKIQLSEEDLVIADDIQALSLAGIKGGKPAEVTKDTNNCLFELANFNPTIIRKTSTRLNLRTDASKIFENGITTYKTEEALEYLLSLIAELDNECEIEFVAIQKLENKEPDWIELDTKEIANLIGKKMGVEEIVNLLKAQNFEVEASGKKLKVKGTKDRTDINITEDLVEEVLRLHGFENVESVPLNLPKDHQHSPIFLLENFLRVRLQELGYTEIFTYTFVDKGEVKVKAGLAEDKMFLRKNLHTGVLQAFLKNYNYLPILETKFVKCFEIGSVFREDGEQKNCVILLEDNNKKSKFLEEIKNDLQQIFNELGIAEFETETQNEKPAYLEFSLDKILTQILNKKVVVPFLEIKKNLQDIKYKPISPFPFIVRDIALWVPKDFNFENLRAEIVNLDLQNFEKIYKFDEFKKIENGEERNSIAFRMIFQSYSKTLTDEEVETEIQKVYNYLKTKNLQVR